jgi:6-phosphogluconolactonase
MIHPHLTWLPARLLLVSATLACTPSVTPIDNSSAAPPPATERKPQPYLYVGNEGGLTWYAADTSAGTLDKKGSLDFGLTASFMVGASDGKHFYALLRTVNEMNQTTAGKPLDAQVASFDVDPATGALREIGRVDSGGDRPTYITLDRNNRFVLIANALGHQVGSPVTVLPVQADGSLGSAQQGVPTGMGAHQVRVHPSNRYVYVPNYWSDYVYQLKFDENTGLLTPNDPPTVPVEMGAQPRHLDFHPSGRWVYLSLEFTATVKTYEVNGDGTLREIQTIDALPPTYTGRRWQSEIRVSPSGRFVYVGERVDESLAIFEVDQQTGLLTLKGHQPTYGKTPRNFALDPTGKLLVVGNQESGSLVTFHIDATTGGLTRLFGPMDQPTPYVHAFLTLP